MLKLGNSTYNDLTMIQSHKKIQIYYYFEKAFELYLKKDINFVHALQTRKDINFVNALK